MQGDRSTKDGQLNGSHQAEETITDRRKQYGKAELERLMYEKIRTMIKTPVRDPTGYIFEVVAAIEKDLQLPKRSLWTAPIPEGKTTIQSSTLVQRTIKRYYDTVGVPANKRHAVKWLN